MILAKYAKIAEKFVHDNSPALFTAVGVVGTVATAYLTGKASFKAAKVIADDEYSKNIRRAATEGPVNLEKTEKAKLVWKLYIPAVTTGAMSVGAIVCANRIGTRRAAAMAAAYSISEKGLKEYKDKVQEKLGINKEQAVRDEIAQDRVNKNPVGSCDVILTGNGDVLFYDIPSDRYFKSSVETVRSVQNDINQQVIAHGYAPLSDLYVALHLNTTPFSEEIGWTTDALLDMQFSTTMSDDKTPCVTINYKADPIRGYNRPD